jgi:hypothetical protein
MTLRAKTGLMHRNKSNEAFRSQTTLKLVTDLPIGP